MLRKVLILNIGAFWGVILVLWWLVLAGVAIVVAASNAARFVLHIRETLSTPPKEITLVLLVLNLKSSTNAFWNGNAHMLAILNIIGIGICMLLTVLVLGCSLLVPLTRRERRKVLLFLRWWAKWALVGVFFLLNALAGIDFEVEPWRGNLDIAIMADEYWPTWVQCGLPLILIALTWTIEYCNVCILRRTDAAEIIPKSPQGYIPEKARFAGMSLALFALALWVPFIRSNFMYLEKTGIVSDVIIPDDSKMVSLSVGNSYTDYLMYYFPSNITYPICVFIAPLVDLFVLILIGVGIEDPSLKVVGALASSMNALEVMFVMSLAYVMETGQLTSFLVDKQVPELCRWFEVHEHEKCFSCNGHWGAGSSWLGGIVLCCLSAHFIFHFFERPIVEVDVGFWKDLLSAEPENPTLQDKSLPSDTHSVEQDPKEGPMFTCPNDNMKMIL